MVKRIFDRWALRTRVGFLAAFILLVVSYILTFLSTQKLLDQANLISHTNKVIHDLDNVLGYITRAESSFRGYIIGNDPTMLDDFDESLGKIDSTIRLIKFLTRDNRTQQSNTDTLLALTEQAVLSLAQRINTFSKENYISPRLIGQSTEGKRLMDRIENHVYKMQGQVRALLVNRTTSISEYSDFIRTLNIISIIIAILLTAYSLFIFNKENKAKNDAARKTLTFREELEDRVEQLGELNKELIELRGIEKYAVTGRIARTIAHEVRNPLTNINLAVEQLKSEQDGDEESLMFFDMISRNSDRINSLVSDLLESTRATELKAESVPVNEILDAALREAEDRIRLNGVHVVKDYDLEICPIQADAQKLKIAFLNLIVNALEATSKDGKLILKTEARDNKCIIRVSDNGKGMSKEQMDRLFEPFFTTKEKGNGLGLANTQNIILSHSGIISAESEEGKGSTFQIVFNL